MARLWWLRLWRGSGRALRALGRGLRLAPAQLSSFAFALLCWVTALALLLGIFLQLTGPAPASCCWRLAGG